MRSAGGMKSVVPAVVTRFNKAMMDLFLKVSFEEGNGSVVAAVGGPQLDAIVEASGRRVLASKTLPVIVIVLRVGGLASSCRGWGREGGAIKAGMASETIATTSNV